MTSGTTRRVVLAVAGAAALGGCSAYGDKADGGGAPAGGPLAKTADIPVGGGKVFEDRQVVVTQPEKGTFKCFTAVCTHAGCTVSEVKGGTINCPCHGSQFKIADGSVAHGPAEKPLAAIPLTVDGDSLEL